jgi:hypothetical protein
MQAVQVSEANVGKSPGRFIVEADSKSRATSLTWWLGEKGCGSVIRSNASSSMKE